MLYRFPENTVAVVVRNYRRPYDDPICVQRGEVIVPNAARTAKTDYVGWTWCKAADGREGWVPDNWIDRSASDWTIMRDFSALELSVDVGDRVTVTFSESGFDYCRQSDGTCGWLPDAVLELQDAG